jgi:hypothetical protein
VWNGPVCMDANTPQALKTLASIKPDVKQQSRIGMDVKDVSTLRVRNVPDPSDDF